MRNLGPLADLRDLDFLEVTHAEVRDVTTLACLSKLVSLNLGHNTIADMSPLGVLENLRGLWIYENDIVDVGSLAPLTNLTEISPFGNRIVDLTPLAELRDLFQLWVFQNRITDLSPLLANPGLGNGDVLDVSSNCLDLSPGAVARGHIDQLRGRGVSVTYQPQDACGQPSTASPWRMEARRPPSATRDGRRADALQPSPQAYVDLLHRDAQPPRTD